MCKINDEYIINYFWRKQFNSKMLNNIPYYINEYLINRYNDSSSLLETINRIKLNIEIVPKCPICGKPLKYINKISIKNLPYEKTCGNTLCLKQLRNVKSKQTKLERYSDPHYVNKEKAEQTKLERYGDPHYVNKEKTEQTNLIKYGVKNVFKNKDIINKIYTCKLERYGDPHYVNKDKAEQTKLERYGDPHYVNKEKAEQTNLMKYGVKNSGGIESSLEKQKLTCKLKYSKDYFFQTDEFKEKFKNTSLQKFGTDFPIQSEYVKNKINYNQIVIKQNETKRLNHSFNKSNPEDTCYKLLTKKFNKVKRQYKDNKRYPFYCDFYICDIDMFIEYNGFWTHGGHPFDENNLDDINKLNIWKTKNNSFYIGAIYNWTIRDVNKRNIAKENKLNYLEFYNIKDFKNWINNFDNITK